MRLHRVDVQPSPRIRDACAEQPIVAQMVQATLDLYQRRGFLPPWVGYLAERDARIVGSCGFTGPPQNGEVEIAYFTYPGHEGQGIASEMAALLVQEAGQSGSDAACIAHTLPEEGPSTRILRKLGVDCIGLIEHPEDGAIWKWRLGRPGAAAA